MAKEVKESPNKDRHLCKKCVYRSGRTGMGRCNYIAVAGHSRGCKPEECTVFVKGRKRQESAVVKKHVCDIAQKGEP